MSYKNNNLFLIGPMGSGKTSVGKCIAQQSKLRFCDVDAEIVARSGVDIDWIFEQEGEAGFRRREKRLIEQLSKQTNIVLSTGGGCVTQPENCQCLAQHGTIVYLQVSLATQIERLMLKANKRPLFASNANPDKLRQLNASRTPLYESIANLSYKTDKLFPQQLAKTILKDYQQLSNGDNT